MLVLVLTIIDILSYTSESFTIQDTCKSSNIDSDRVQRPTTVQSQQQPLVRVAVSYLLSQLGGFFDA